MRKAILAFYIAVLSAAAVSAQAVSDYKKGEGYVGYSNGQVDRGFDSGSSLNDFFDDRANFNGFEAAGVYNLGRYFGIKGDVSGTYNSTRFSGPVNAGGGSTATVSLKTSNSLYNFLGGVQVKDNSRAGRFKPFAHALVGAAHARSKISDFTCTGSINCSSTLIPPDTISDTGWAGAFGGGIDIRVNDSIQIRAFQADYNPVRINGFTQHNARFGAGIVF